MSPVRHERNKGRQTAVQLLYAAELTEEEPKTIADAGAAPEEVVLDEYAMALLAGVEAHREEIDGLLAGASENWALSRMPVVDKCILRLGVYEMLYVDEVPVAVTINEAVELAKVFGGEDDSHRFVNGVLGRIAQQCSGEAAGEAGDEAQTAAEEAGDDVQTAAEEAGDEARAAAEKAGDEAEAAGEDTRAAAAANDAAATEETADESRNPEGVR